MVPVEERDAQREDALCGPCVSQVMAGALRMGECNACMKRIVAAPTAGVTSMFAVRYGRDAESAAQVITLTTLLSIITLPIFGVLATAWS